MAADGRNEPKPRNCLGFLTVLECPRDGLFGGYLALDFRGRPLEFRCTAPIKPNRAQQILYGATLDDYLYGEQIGKTLLTGCKNTPLVVCTNQSSVLAVRELIDTPVALVEAPEEQPDVAPSNPATTPPGDGGKTWRLHAAHAPGPPQHFHLGHNRLFTPVAADATRIAERLAELPDGFDLVEPFARIREAIEEARRAGGE